MSGMRHFRQTADLMNIMAMFVDIVPANGSPKTTKDYLKVVKKNLAMRMENIMQRMCSAIMRLNLLSRRKARNRLSFFTSLIHPLIFRSKHRLRLGILTLIFTVKGGINFARSVMRGRKKSD